VLCLCLSAIVLGLSAVSAQAGPSGSWTQVTGFGGGVQAGDEIGLERTSDGRLHGGIAGAATGTNDCCPRWP
jgi:hypothetical protein